MESRGTVETTVRAVLYGQPNTGKSSLFNALTRKEQALVSELPGTTRDYLVAVLDFDGRKCRLIDTAGFQGELARTTGISNVPDRAAQEAAVEQTARAHVRLLCLDATRTLNAWEQAELARDDNLHQIIVWTKIDAAQSPGKLSLHSFPNRPAVLTSSITGEGLDLLRAELRRMALGVATAASDVVSSTAARCRQSLHRAGASLQNAQSLLLEKSGEEFIASEIRAALEELGKIVGAVYTDDILDRIFSRFCVGK
jgi:tRNA modification GTPase